MAKCKVCHRTLTNPAHIAAGMGPVCAAKAAARASVSDAAAARRAYPVERYEMIVAGCEKLANMRSRATRDVVQAYATRNADELAEAQRVYLMVTHWYERVKRMEQRAYRLLTQKTMTRAA